MFLFQTSLRVLDCLFYEGDKILFRVALTLLQINSKELEKNCHTFPQILQRIQKMVADPSTLFCHEFMQVRFQHVVSNLLSDGLVFKAQLDLHVQCSLIGEQSSFRFNTSVRRKEKNFNPQRIFSEQKKLIHLK